MECFVQSFIWILFTLCPIFHRTISIKIKELNVWGGLGGAVKLPCPPSPEISGESPVLTLWFKGSNTEAIYSFDTRSTKFPEGTHWSDEVILGRRATFTAESSVPYLTLKPVLKEDHEVFTCRVDYQISPSTQVKVNLSVAIPPGLPEVYWKGKPITSSIGPLNENERFDLVCRAKGGFPQPTITWWQQGRLLEAESDMSPEGVASSTIPIVASRAMHEVPFVCHARSQHPDHTLSRPRTTAVTLNIKLPPLTINIYGAKGPTVEGMTIDPYCRSSGSHPPAELSWWLNDRRLSHVSRSIQENGNVSSSTVRLTLTKADNGGTLSCQAVNSLLPDDDDTLTDSVQLNVFYKPIIQLRLGQSLDASNLKEGQDAFFDCQVSANPPPHRLQWFHDDRPISQNENMGVIISGSSLALQKLNKKNSGNYSCVAENLEARVTSNEVNLIIKYSPKCTPESKLRTQGAAKGRSTSILCRVDAYPASNLTFSWSHTLPSGEEVTLAMQNISIEGHMSQLTIFPRRINDFGPYLCRATNAIGVQDAPCVIQLVTEGPPEPPANCSSNSFEDALTISCREGFHGGFPQKFLLQAWQKETLVANITNDSPEWTLQELKTDQSIRLTLQSLNSKGTSDSLQFEIHPPVANLQATTESTGNVRDFSILAGIVMGILSVVFCFMAFIIVLIQKTKSRKPPIVPDQRKSLLRQQSSGEDLSLAQKGRTQDATTTSDDTDGLSLASSGSFDSSIGTPHYKSIDPSNGFGEGLPSRNFSKSVPDSLASHNFHSLNRRDTKTRQPKCRKTTSNVALEGDERTSIGFKTHKRHTSESPKVPSTYKPSAKSEEDKKRDSFHLIEYASTPLLNRTSSRYQGASPISSAPIATDEVNESYHDFSPKETRRTKVNRKRNSSESKSKVAPRCLSGSISGSYCDQSMFNKPPSHSNKVQKVEPSHEQLYVLPYDTLTSRKGAPLPKYKHYSEVDLITPYPKLPYKSALEVQTLNCDTWEGKGKNMVDSRTSDHEVIVVDSARTRKPQPSVPKRNGLRKVPSTTRMKTSVQRESMV